MKLFATEGPWLFSRRLDLLAFGGSALASYALIAIGALLGLLDREVPAWTFVACVIAVDVAHVWSMGFRVYFDPHERRARPLLYFGVPALGYVAGVALHAVSAIAFWRALAYLAVFHFVRQQAGFMRLYARKNPHQTRLDGLLEQLALYASMLYPLLFWHAHLPRGFSWFVPGDFVSDAAVAGALRGVLPVAELGCYGLLALFCARQLQLFGRGQLVAGKSLLMLATFSCWVLGVVVFDSDYVFTVTNVLIHGIPYFVLTHRYARATLPAAGATRLRRLCAAGFVPFVLLCFVLALTEELLWNELVWHDWPALWTDEPPLPKLALVFAVPLLALPQVTHYVLDGFLWRVRTNNPVLRRELESA